MSPRLRIGELVLFEGDDVPNSVAVYEAVDGTTVSVDTSGIDLGVNRRDLVVESQVHLAGKVNVGNPRKTAEGRRVFQLDRSGIGQQRLPDGRIALVELTSGPLIESRRGVDGRPTKWVNPDWRRGVEG